jgi:UDP-glucose 4-epimerase
MKLRDARILVTGGAGFIGSQLVDRLIAMGAEVRILDNLLTGDERNINPQAEFIRADLRDYEAVSKSVEGIDLIFHEAAQINPAKAVEDPIFDFDINARGTLNLLVAAQKAGVKKLLMASTNLYADADLSVMKEDASVLFLAKSMLSPYAAAKAAGEAYLKVFNDEFKLSTVRLRYTNVYGPRQLKKSESGVIAIFTKSALRGEPLIIFGDGLQTRDFVYISDVVEANILAAESDAADGMVFNVGTGVETSIRDLARMIKDQARTSSEIVAGPHRAADFRRVNADISLARRILNWSPLVSMKEGLGRYIAWCTDNQDRL